MTQPTEAHGRLALLDRLIRIQTLSGSVTDAHVAAVIDFWRELGIAFERLTPDDPAGTPALFAELDSGKPGPTVLLYGHYDVQPPGDLDRWRWGGTPCDPWAPRYFRAETEVQPSALSATELNGVVLVGRGGADNKGQHLANILEAHYRDTGVGVVAEVPALLSGGSAGATYSQEFGDLIR